MAEPLGTNRTSFIDSLGARGRRRAEPRASIALAGAGCVLAILGVLAISGDIGTSTAGDDFNRFPGLILSALVVAAGFATLSLVAAGAAATAGTVAAALGMPALLFFLTFDEGSLPPYSSDLILIGSTIVWVAAYAVGAGRGRPFFLGAGLLGAWASLLQVTEDAFDAPWNLLSGWFAYAPEQAVSFGRPGVPDLTTMGVLSLLTGVAYLLLARRLDRRGQHGVATPFAVAALPILAAAILLLSNDLEQAGTGLLMVIIGLGLTVHGATTWRRATTWLGGGAVALGAAIFLGDMTDDGTIAGMLFLAAGIGIVAGGHALAAALREPDEMERTAPADAIVGQGHPGLPDVDPDGQWAPPPDDPPRPPPPF
jgi:hypothetical protein